MSREAGGRGEAGYARSRGGTPDGIQVRGSWRPEGIRTALDARLGHYHRCRHAPSPFPRRPSASQVWASRR